MSHVCQCPRQVVYVNADGSVVVKRFGKDHAVAAYDWPEWSASAVRVWPQVETPPSGETVKVRAAVAVDDLRDWFAGQAIQSLRGGDFETFRDMAHDAYAIADALLSARKETGDE
jgi:hypothetical protein